MELWLIFSFLISFKPLSLFQDFQPMQRDISLCTLEIPTWISPFLDSYCSAERRPLSTAHWVLKQPIISWVNCRLSSFLDWTYSGTRKAHQRSAWAWYTLLNCYNNQALCGACGAELQSLEESKWISTCKWWEWRTSGGFLVLAEDRNWEVMTPGSMLWIKKKMLQAVKERIETVARWEVHLFHLSHQRKKKELFSRKKKWGGEKHSSPRRHANKCQYSVCYNETKVDFSCCLFRGKQSPRS